MVISLHRTDSVHTAGKIGGMLELLLMGWLLF